MIFSVLLHLSRPSFVEGRFTRMHALNVVADDVAGATAAVQQFAKQRGLSIEQIEEPRTASEQRIEKYALPEEIVGITNDDLVNALDQTTWSEDFREEILLAHRNRTAQLDFELLAA